MGYIYNIERSELIALRAAHYDDVEAELVTGTRSRSRSGQGASDYDVSPSHPLTNASRYQEYMVTGRLEALQGPRVVYSVFPTDLPSDEKHNMQLDPKYIPQPTVNNGLSSAFHLPIGVNIAYDTSSILLFVLYLISFF